MDGSIRGFAPSHPGAIVVYVGDLDFSTDVIGKSPDVSFKIMVPSLALLAIDDTKSGGDADGVNNTRGISFWKVRRQVLDLRLCETHPSCLQSEGYAILAEIEDLDMNLQSTTGIPSSNLVSINHYFAP